MARARSCSPHLLAAVAALLLAAAPAGAQTGGRLEVRVEGDVLTAALGPVPIADVLADVARQTGARLSINGDLGAARPQAFNRLPLAQALSRIAQPNGVILEFDPGGSSRRLVAIRAVAPGAGGGPRSPDEPVRVTPRASMRNRAPVGLWNYDDPNRPLPKLEERVASIAKLTERGGEQAKPSLIYVVRNDPEAAVRRSALGWLTRFEGEDVRAALTQAMTDENSDIRGDALRALAAAPDKPVTLLAQAARGDGSTSVRLVAISALGASDGDLARGVLESLLQDPDSDVRLAAEQALRR